MIVVSFTCVPALEVGDVASQRLHRQDPGGGPRRPYDRLQGHQASLAGLRSCRRLQEEPAPHHLSQPAAAPVHQGQLH